MSGEMGSADTPEPTTDREPPETDQTLKDAGEPAEGTADPSRKINSGVATFYPNSYFPDTFTVLTYAPR